MSGESILLLLGVVGGVAGLWTATYIVRDRRTVLLRSLYDTEKLAHEKTSDRLMELREENAELRARPNLEGVSDLVARLLKEQDVHELRAASRAERHEERAAERHERIITAFDRVIVRLDGVDTTGEDV